MKQTSTLLKKRLFHSRLYAGVTENRAKEKLTWFSFEKQKDTLRRDGVFSLPCKSSGCLYIKSCLILYCFPLCNEDLSCFMLSQNKNDNVNELLYLAIQHHKGKPYKQRQEVGTQSLPVLFA